MAQCCVGLVPRLGEVIPDPAGELRPDAPGGGR